MFRFYGQLCVLYIVYLKFRIVYIGEFFIGELGVKEGEYMKYRLVLYKFFFYY